MDLRPKTQPMFMPTALAIKQAGDLIETENDLKEAEDSPMNRAVCSLLRCMSFQTKQTDEIFSEVKYNSTMVTNLDLKTREIEIGQRRLQVDVDGLKQDMSKGDQENRFVKLLLGQGWKICCAVLLLVVGGLITIITSVIQKGITP